MNSFTNMGSGDNNESMEYRYRRIWIISASCGTGVGLVTEASADSGSTFRLLSSVTVNFPMVFRGPPHSGPEPFAPV